MKRLHALFYLIALLHCTKLSGTSDETLSGVSAKVCYENGDPAPKVTVCIFEVDDTTRRALDEVETDKNGYFEISEVPTGMYNIITKKDTLVAMVDSVVINQSRQLDKITIKPQSSIAGLVTVEPNHTPVIVTVQVLGTYLFANVDANGTFTLSGLAEGKYTLCFQTTSGDYTPTYVSIEVIAGTVGTIDKTVKMRYSGIPVITQISASYDTTNGVVLVQWSPVAYHNLAGYMLFRKEHLTPDWPKNYIAATADTVYRDTIDFGGCNRFDGAKNGCRFDFNYRVIARGKNDMTGEPYALCNISVVSPKVMIPTAAAGADTVLPSGTSVLLKGSNSFALPGTIKEYAWDIGVTKIFIPCATGDTLVTAPEGYDDTLTCILRVTGIDGSKSYDTVSVVSSSFLPATGNAAFSPRTGLGCIEFHDTLWIVGGESINNGGANNEIWFSLTGADWELLPVSYRFSARTEHTCLEYHDTVWVIGGWSSGSRFNDVWCSANMRDWVQKTPSAAFSPRAGHTSVVFDGKLWVIGGTTLAQGIFDVVNDVWYSENGSEWVEATDSAAFSKRWAHASVVFDGKIWVIGGQGNTINASNDIWYSSNGVDWSSGGSVGNRNWWHSKATVFKEKIWLIGTTTMGESVQNTIMSSMDGFRWEIAIGHPPFTQRGGHGQTVYKNKLWVIGGSQNVTCYNDIWYLK
jgi:5-hydroxyisourate hydrolase-like protein (transthyretin family)